MAPSSCPSPHRPGDFLPHATFNGALRQFKKQLWIFNEQRKDLMWVCFPKEIHTVTFSYLKTMIYDTVRSIRESRSYMCESKSRSRFHLQLRFPLDLQCHASLLSELQSTSGQPALGERWFTLTHILDTTGKTASSMFAARRDPAESEHPVHHVLLTSRDIWLPDMTSCPLVTVSLSQTARYNHYVWYFCS